MIFKTVLLLILAAAIESRLQKHQGIKVRQHHNVGSDMKRHQIGHRNIPRFTIPRHDENSKTVEPEIINVVKKSGTLKDNDLPGAFGEDESLGDTFVDGSADSGSGSGSGNTESESKPEVLKHLVTHDKKAETAANFGNNVVPKPGINPTSAFITKEQNHKGFTGADKSVNQNKKKHKKKNKINKRIKGKSKKLKNKMGKVRSLEKSKDKPTSVHHKDTDIIKEIQNIAKQIDAVEKKKKKKKIKKEKQNSNITKKVSSYIKKLENHLKDEVKSVSKSHHKKIDTSDEDDGSTSSEDVTGKSNLAVAQAGSPEGFECPWVCYWTCHSYCPKECCNNPFHCPHQCKEFCTPYCSDKCCAPGTRRMPKLELNLKTPEETGKRDNNTIPQNKTADLLMAQNETTQIAKQLEALKQASYYAAQALGLPNSCPLFCTRICTPGLCKPECCSRSETHRLPQLLAAAVAATTPNQPPAPAPAPAPAAPKPVAQSIPAPLPLHPGVSAPAAVVSPVSTASKTQAAPLPAPPTPAAAQQASAVISPPAPAAGKNPPVQAKAPSPPIEGSSINPATIPGLVPETGKGEKIGQFSIRQPNGQIQTFNIESGPIIAVPEPQGIQTNAPQNPQTKTESIAIQPPATSTQRSYCPTPINCPEGNLVDPDYCPPICRTACIDQCPNECCPNYSADHQKR